MFKENSAGKPEQVSSGKEQISREQAEQIKKEFIKEVHDRLSEIDPNFIVPEEDFDTIGVNENGEINGHIYDLRINNWGEHMYEYPIDAIVASILREKGVKVFHDNVWGGLIVAEKPERGYDDQNVDRVYLNALYSSSGFGTYEAIGRAAVFSDTLLTHPGAYYKDGKVFTRTDLDSNNLVEIPEFTDTADDVIKKYRERTDKEKGKK